MAFATDLGFNRVGCNLGGSLLGSVAALLQLSDVLSSPILQGVSACGQLAVLSVAALERLTAISGQLEVLNPVLNPLLELVASNVQLLADSFGEELAPLTETLATLAPTIRYFLGED